MVANNPAEYAALGFTTVPGTDQSLSSVTVPILGSDRVLGSIALENYERENAFGEAEVRLLTTVAAGMGVALENARLFDETQRLLKETEQRATELAVINSIQEGMAAELDFQAIIDLVGDKLREVFHTGDLGIRWFDTKANLSHYLYTYEHGVRISVPPATPEPGGVWSKLVETRQPIVANSRAEYAALGLITIPGTDIGHSTVVVPILGSDRVLGSIMLEDFDRENAFGEAEMRLLTTVAAGMGVALENARLFDETKRLLAETDERAAELSIINSVQQGLAGRLEMQAMYDLVGHKIQEIFDAQVVDIMVVDRDAGLMQFVYGIEKGVRLFADPIPIIGFRKHVLETREPLSLSGDMVRLTAQYGNPLVISGEVPKSALFVPLVAGGVATGVISLQNIDREDAFGDGDIRLLTTLAGSLSVALENVRLFEETKRLLSESSERAAELAIINSVQQGLASQIDMQAMYDLVGDKLVEIFDAQVVDIGLFDLAAGVIRYPYTIERGVRFPDQPGPIRNFAKLVLDTRRSLLVNDVPAWEAERGIESTVLQGEPALSVLFAPLIVGTEVRGRISLQNIDRTDAFSESDERLLTTLASSLSVALENARLVDETRQRAAELAIVNEVGQAAAAQLDLDRLIQLTGELLRTTFRADIVYVALLNKDTGFIDFPYRTERGKAAPRPPGAGSGRTRSCPAAPPGTPRGGRPT